MTYRIGVDSRLLSEKVTGIGRYTSEMLSRLVETEHEWYLYSHMPITIGHWQRPNVHLRTSNFPGRPLRMLWAQSLMPWQAARDRVDLFWAPTHRLPRYLNRNIASVVTVHDLVWKHAGETMQPARRWLDARLMPEAARLADRIIAVSASTADDLACEVPEAAGKIKAIPHGAPDPASQTSHTTLTGMGLSEPFFLFVGTLEPRKNLSRLIEAYAKLPESLQTKAKLAIAGGKGWGGVDIKTLCENHGVTERVHVLGYVTEEQLSGLYAQALFLAMPSLYEGFGLPLLEAMAHGKPTLTSDRSSMPEVVGETGILIDPDDVDSIGNGLSKLIGDPVLRQRLGEAARDRAQEFSWDRAVSQTLTVFDEAIAARATRQGSRAATT